MERKKAEAKSKNWCVVPGCQSDSRKKNDLTKYPWMEGVTFVPFPTAQKQPKLRSQWLEMIRRPKDYRPAAWHRVCSRHFTNTDVCKESVPVLFPWNNYKQPTNPRPTTSIQKRGSRPILKETVQPARDFQTFPDSPDLGCYEVLEETVSGYQNKDIISHLKMPPVVLEVDVQTNESSSSYLDKENVHGFETDHDYSIHAKIINRHSYVPDECITQDCGTQTDLSGVDINCLQSKVETLEQKLGNKDTLLRELFVEKVIQNDKSVRTFTGLPNLETFNCISEITTKYEPNLKYWRGNDSVDEKKYQQNGKKTGPSRKLTNMQELVITLVRLRLALPLCVLSSIFGVSGSRISSIFTTWIFYLYFVFKDQIIWPSRDLIRKHMPSSFKKSFPRTRAIIDCSEIFIQRPRNPTIHSKTYSTYKSRNTFKFLVSISPTGAIYFISKIWGGNTSDRFITANSGFLDLISPGDEIMADQGFTIRDLLTERRAYLTIPPFTHKCRWGKGKRLNANEIKRTRKIANLRIHVERAIQRMKAFKLVSQIIPWTMKSVVNPMVVVIAFFCNLLQPLFRK